MGPKATEQNTEKCRGGGAAFGVGLWRYPAPHNSFLPTYLRHGGAGPISLEPQPPPAPPRGARLCGLLGASGGPCRLSPRWWEKVKLVLESPRRREGSTPTRTRRTASTTGGAVRPPAARRHRH